MTNPKLIFIIIMFILVVFMLFINNYDQPEQIHIEKIPTEEIHIEKYTNKEIDIVITWVDNTEEFKKERDIWLKNDIYQKPSEPRYSQYEELKYLLRSIEKHFPNYNKIYLVVKDGQFPSYLKRDNPNLQVVNHSEIIPKENLPTFNSRAIEMYLHHIPNLTENYLYANDDIIITKDLSKSYYFDQNEVPYVYLTNIQINNNETNIDKLTHISNAFMCGLNFNSLILDEITKKENRFEVPHHWMIYNKSFDNQIEKYFKNYFYNHNKNNAFDTTGASKFRRCDDLYLVSLIKPYLYKNWFNAETKKVNSVIINNYNNLVEIDAPFICLEDITDNNFDKFTKFMTHLFPEKSSFEI